MRMRRKKHGPERLAACRELLCERPAAPLRGAADLFGREAPLYLEIGCGKGGFIRQTAKERPKDCFLAMERVANVMITAVENAKAEAAERPDDNLRFAVADATALGEWFAPRSLDGIFLNFSDPWPKEGHKKRRLTHRDFLHTYFALLKEGGELRFKTDNVGLFDFTLEELAALGVTPAVLTRDLHHSPYAQGNVMTEYERNFSGQGYPIHMLTVRV